MNEYEELLKAFSALKRNDEQGLLADIGSAVRPYYEDFRESSQDPMDLELGEVYRVMLDNVFKALTRKGVKM